MGNQIDKFAYHKLMRSAGKSLTHTEYRILSALWDYSGPQLQNAHPGNANLAADCGVSEDTVERAIGNLLAKGWIRRDRAASSGGRYGSEPRAAVYSLQVPDDTQSTRTDAGSLAVNEPAFEVNQPANRFNEPANGDQSTRTGAAPSDRTDQRTNRTDAADAALTDLEAQKAEARKWIRELVGSTAPVDCDRNHLTNTAAKAVAELGADQAIVSAALGEWLGNPHQGPGKLRELIQRRIERRADTPAHALRASLAELRAGSDVLADRLTSYGYVPPDNPHDITKVAEAKAFHRRHKIAWLEAEITKIENTHTEELECA